MTNEPRSAVEALFGPETYEQEEATRKRVREECRFAMVACHLQILGKLNGDFAAASRIFDEFAKTARKLVPKRGRGEGRKNATLNVRLETAHKQPREGIESAIIAATGAKTLKETETPLRQARRLAARRKQQDQAMAEAASGVVAAMQTGSSDAITAAFREAGRRLTARRSSHTERTNNPLE